MKKKTTCIKKSVESSPVADIATELGEPAKRFKLKQLRPALSDLQLQGEHVKDLQLQGEHVQVVIASFALHCILCWRACWRRALLEKI